MRVLRTLMRTNRMLEKPICISPTHAHKDPIKIVVTSFRYDARMVS
jgi:hypothetical protein